MKRALRISTAAHRDLEQGDAFYEALHLGLGARFLMQLKSDIQSLQEFAGIHPKIHGHSRMLAQRFPYAIYYRLTPTNIDVLRVLDCRQNPERIRSIFP